MDRCKRGKWIFVGDQEFKGGVHWSISSHSDYNSDLALKVILSTSWIMSTQCYSTTNAGKSFDTSGDAWCHATSANGDNFCCDMSESGWCRKEIRSWGKSGYLDLELPFFFMLLKYLMRSNSSCLSLALLGVDSARSPSGSSKAFFPRTR